MMRDAIVLATWILLATAWLVVHWIALAQVLRIPRLPTRWRLLALFVPPLTPVVLVKFRGTRVVPFFWCLLLAGYLVARFYPRTAVPTDQIMIEKRKAPGPKVEPGPDAGVPAP